MENWRVIITDGLQNPGIDILKNESRVFEKKGISADDLKKEISDYDALIVRSRTKVTRQLIEAATSLKVIARAGVGVDNIDIEAAKEKGITVVNSASATTTAVAELTIGLIFSLAREIPRADSSMKRGEWLKNDLMGVELNGKTLGIIGYGRIGASVAQIASAAGMRIIACGDYIIPETIRIVGGELLTLKDVIENSDFITVHVPLTEKTRGLINKETINKMKDGVYLLCSARGGIIDETALLNSLNSGKVAGAALDVFENEPPTNLELITHSHLIATPHIAGQTSEAQNRASVDIANEVLAALKGEKLHWRIV
jgi:D-3-phosphoglycerate dehydrogenase / 2-oxoglutarate reductase